ncbi:putative medium-chain acyl-[acyl-carrier-protein] hydrolase [Monocercomonoides exilis]|uniref:putative medium-chain acyl-[acyl-carrier-protein] hydrolase n=1 Tax=Monocercomonoides exilis TaxID=2049356 RepID=UPI0035594491|nr:putative medium-chain acyl-[acyl-carrier-protein] hydrolase [Monocercomonoides exilis]|eukprot:MONOS_2204.1-p1 / transcript=MONOS_2204.1 / gene=MONOS_2204 / organism=Monocercomonoides_exilis_PA203 / gene_product=medium-chain acyl-[acyl-carrier-protein] hydrolase / transcript_product=medium-chain acyl-[acyl-carrier-protein] hydrolase / location=Mono_scaffold00044:3333-4572(-) / protein_length=331 / sequence_SO=supercontig / SO=protein_coding / is_pseudo=false
MSRFCLRSFPKRQNAVVPFTIEQYNSYLIVPEKRPNAVVRLFCFPFAGGNASTYSAKWSSDLPKSIEYVAVQYPGRQGRSSEPFITDMKELVSQITDALTPLIKKGNKPYSFFAHSLGTLVAYETALEIRRRKLPMPEQLILSGRGAPGTTDPFGKPIDCGLPDREFADLCVSRFGPSPGLIDQRLFSVSLPPLRADMKLYYSYTPLLSEDSTPSCPIPLEKPLAVPVTVFGATGDPLSQPEMLQTWQRFFTDEEDPDEDSGSDSESSESERRDDLYDDEMMKRKKELFFERIVIDEPFHHYLERRNFKEDFMRCLSSLVVRSMEEEVWC